MTGCVLARYLVTYPLGTLHHERNSYRLYRVIGGPRYSVCCRRHDVHPLIRDFAAKTVRRVCTYANTHTTSSFCLVYSWWHATSSSPLKNLTYDGATLRPEACLDFPANLGYRRSSVFPRGPFEVRTTWLHRSISAQGHTIDHRDEQIFSDCPDRRLTTTYPSV